MQNKSSVEALLMDINYFYAIMTKEQSLKKGKLCRYVKGNDASFLLESDWCHDAPPQIGQVNYSMSNVILADIKVTLFHQYLRYSHKCCTIVLSLLGAIL